MNNYNLPTACSIDGATLVYQKNATEAYCQIHHEIIGEVRDDVLSYYKWYQDELELIEAELEAGRGKFRKFLLASALWQELDRKVR